MLRVVGIETQLLSQGKESVESTGEHGLSGLSDSRVVFFGVATEVA